MVCEAGADGLRWCRALRLLGPELAAPQSVHADGAEEEHDGIDGMAVTQRGVRQVVKQRKDHGYADNRECVGVFRGEKHDDA